jgi:Hemerythrin HHE cation binding domain
MNTIIHAAFRRDFARFDQAFASFPAGSHARADQLGAAWDNVEFQLHHHHQDEETIFFPTLLELGADETLVSDLKGEHAVMLAALETASSSMKEFHTDPTEQNAEAARGAVAGLHDAFNSHVTHEERDLEPFAASQKSTPQMKAALKAVRKAHKGVAGTFFAWLMDGNDPDAAAGLRHEVPPPVLFVIGRVGGRDYRSRIAPVWS